MTKIEVPSHWSKQDVDGFLKYLKPDPEDRQERENLKVLQPTRHCWLNGGCMFWIQVGKEEYYGHCGLGSCACITAVFNRRNPTRWLPK